MLRQRVGHIPHQPHFCQRNARAVGWINSGGGRHSRCVNHTRDAARGPRQDHMIAQGGWKRRIFGIGPKCGGLPGSKLVHPFSMFNQYAPPAPSLAPDTILSPVLHRRPKQQCEPEPWPRRAATPPHQVLPNTRVVSGTMAVMLGYSAIISTFIIGFHFYADPCIKSSCAPPPKPRRAVREGSVFHETCPISTGGGTRRVQLVREGEGGGGGELCGKGPFSVRACRGAARSTCRGGLAAACTPRSRALRPLSSMCAAFSSLT